MTVAFINEANKLAWIATQLVGEVPVGFTVIECDDEASAGTHYYDGESINAYTEEQLNLKRDIPTYDAIWSDLSMSWVDQRTLANIKYTANKRINADRLLANISGFVYSDKLFSTDALSRSDIDGIANYVSLNNSLPVDWVGAWKAVDNTYLEITTVQEWKDFYAAMVSVGTANFVKAQALKAQIAAATSIAEVEAIVW